MPINKIEFFTIVLNGMPFIKYHLSLFEKLNIPWTWHIIEGVAEHKYDTAWSKSNGATIPKKFYSDEFLSIDGTSQYIDSISSHPNIKIYRKEGLWDGKLEMINTPLSNMTFSDSTLLFQIDVDELWTPENIQKIIDVYNSNDSLNCGYYYCYFFVGKNKYIVSDNTYGTGYNHWPRTWRLREGSKWVSHEPPSLICGNINLSNANIIDRDVTKQLDITFEHYAYYNIECVEFKEFYYGYTNAVDQWKQLQNIKGKVNINQYLKWTIPFGATIADDWNKPKLIDTI